MARKAKFLKSVFEETGTVRIDFGQAGGISVNLAEMPESIVTRLALHGLAQKLGDAYAGVSDPKAAKQAAEAVAARLRNGEWRARSGDGTARPSQALADLAAAVASVKKIDPEEALEKIQRLDRKSRNALRAHPQIMAALARIRAKREQQDLDELLG